MNLDLDLAKIENIHKVTDLKIQALEATERFMKASIELDPQTHFEKHNLIDVQDQLKQTSGLMELVTLALKIKTRIEADDTDN